jgi:hypothetical protein
VPRQNRTGEAYDLLVTLNSTARTIGLTQVRGGRTPSKIQKQFLPNGPLGSQSQPFTVAEWAFKAGTAGAGWSEETPASSQAGGYENGVLAGVWSRRDGVLQPPGELTEVTLPLALRSTTDAVIYDSAEVGTTQDLWLTTATNMVVRIANGTDDPVLVTFNDGIRTLFTSQFAGSGASKLYVTAYEDAANTVAPLLIYDPDTDLWSSAVSGPETRLIFLGDPIQWTLGPDTSGGGVPSAGTSVVTLVGVGEDQDGVYHVVGDPSDPANWSGFIPAGDGTAPINSVLTANHVAWFGAANGVFTLNELGVSSNIAEWMRESRDPLNGVAFSRYYDGDVWFSHKMGVVLVPVSGERQDVASFAQFGRAGFAGPIFGRPRAMSPDPWGMFVAYYDDDGTSYVMHASKRADGSLRWSGPEAIVPGAITHLRYTTPSTGPRLWIGAIDPLGLPHLYWVSQPSTGDPESDYLHGGSMRYATEWGVALSRFDLGNPHPKAYRRFSSQHRYVGGANTLEYHLSVDGADFVRQGTATRSPHWSATPAADTGRGVQTQIKLLAHNTRTTPILIVGAAVRLTPQPERTQAYTYQFDLSESAILTNGNVSTHDPGVILSLLEQCQREGPLQMVDHHGRSFEGVIESVDEELTEESEGYSVIAQVTVSVSRRLARFNRSLFSAGESFS